MGYCIFLVTWTKYVHCSYSEKEQEENELVCKTTCSQAYHVVENKGVRVLSNWLQVTDKVHNITTLTIWLQP